jgi:hypothetical protein
MKYLSKYLYEGIASKTETIRVSVKKNRNINGSTNVEAGISILSFPFGSCKKYLLNVRTLK